MAIQQTLAPIVSVAAMATTFNCMGNLGIRSILNVTSPYSGAVIAGLTTTTCFALSAILSNNLLARQTSHLNEKRFLIVTLSPLIGGAMLTKLISFTAKSNVSLIASIGYSILGFAATRLYFVYEQKQPLHLSFRDEKRKYSAAWKYLIN
jgi:cyanate permease